MLISVIGDHSYYKCNNPQATEMRANATGIETTTRVRQPQIIVGNGDVRNERMIISDLHRKMERRRTKSKHLQPSSTSYLHLPQMRQRPSVMPECG